MHTCAHSPTDPTVAFDIGEHLCGIPARTLPPCDLPWGHDGDMHSNAGDGFHARDFAEEHAFRQRILADLDVARADVDRLRKALEETEAKRAALADAVVWLAGAVDELVTDGLAVEDALVMGRAAWSPERSRKLLRIRALKEKT